MPTNNPTKPLISEKAAKWLRWPFAAMATFFSILFVGQAFSVAGWAIGLMLAIWPLMTGICLRAANAAKDGITGTELLQAFLWPLVVPKLASAEGRASMHIDAKDDTSSNLMDETAAVLFTWLLIGAGIVMAISSGIGCALRVAGGLVWLAVYLYFAGMGFYYLLARPWRQGITTANVVGCILWFLSVFTYLGKKESDLTA